MGEKHLSMYSQCAALCGFSPTTGALTEKKVLKTDGKVGFMSLFSVKGHLIFLGITTGGKTVCDMPLVSYCA